MDNESGTIKVPNIISYFKNQFVKLLPSKAPLSWQEHTLKEIENYAHIGIKLIEPFIVVDIDDTLQAEKLTNLIVTEKIKCQIMQTTKGRHFWFKVKEPLKNSVKTCTGIGLFADYRCWGKQSQVCIKLNEKWREWLTNYEWDTLDELPRYLRPLRQDKWKFCGMVDGDGRNQALFEYQIELSKRGFSQQEAVHILNLINSYIFDNPLPTKELETIYREEAYPKQGLEENNSPWFVENEKGQIVFKHNIMGEHLIKTLKIIYYHGQFYIYRNGRYVDGENEILRTITTLYPTSKKAQRSEVMEYIKINTHVWESEKQEHIINLKNGRLNLKSLTLLPHTPEIIDFQQINASYEPKTYHKTLDQMIEKVFCHDLELVKLFEELLGYILIKNNRYQKLFIFFGDGANGKSTLLRLIRYFVGSDNFSTLSIQDLEDKFKPAELEHKLVNVGDDIPSNQIKDSSKLKSLSRGEAVTVERKNKDPFNLINYAKLIFSTNKIPPVSDKSYGFYRTLVLIPLDAVFSSQDADFNPNIDDEITTPEALSYLLNMGLRGYKRLTKQGKFTESAKVRKALETYQTESAHALQWVFDINLDEEKLKEKPIEVLFSEFKIWCEQTGVKNVPEQKTFSRDICKKFGMESKPGKRINGIQKRYFQKLESSVTA